MAFCKSSFVSTSSDSVLLIITGSKVPAMKKEGKARQSVWNASTAPVIRMVKGNFCRATLAGGIVLEYGTNTLPSSVNSAVGLNPTSHAVADIGERLNESKHL